VTLPSCWDSRSGRDVDEEIVVPRAFLARTRLDLREVDAALGERMSILSSAPECADASSPSEMRKLVMSRPPRPPDRSLSCRARRTAVCCWPCPGCCGQDLHALLGRQLVRHRGPAPGSSLTICTAAKCRRLTNWACAGDGSAKADWRAIGPSIDLAICSSGVWRSGRR